MRKAKRAAMSVPTSIDLSPIAAMLSEQDEETLVSLYGAIRSKIRMLEVELSMVDAALSRRREEVALDD